MKKTRKEAKPGDIPLIVAQPDDWEGDEPRGAFEVLMTKKGLKRFERWTALLRKKSPQAER